VKVNVRHYHFRLFIEIVALIAYQSWRLSSVVWHFVEHRQYTDIAVPAGDSGSRTLQQGIASTSISLDLVLHPLPPVQVGADWDLER
jgi:hypothetical protein